MTLDTIQPLLDWIAAHPDLSGWIVFLFAMGESLAVVGIIVPGVVVMLSIGTLVGLGAINLWYALILAALGAMAGDWISYWLGRHFDNQIRHLWPLSRYPKLIPAGEKFFKRHGGKSVLFGRFVGPLRPIIPAIAGIMHMSQAKFYFMNIVSAILWAPVVILPGVAFGNSLQLAHAVFGKLIILMVILIILAGISGYIAKKLFAYALMTTVNTWGEFFGFDRARENLASFAMTAVLVLTVSFFVVQYEYRYQPVVSVQQSVDMPWWETHWDKFSPATPHTKKFRSDYPLTIQWWGNLQDIKSILSKHQWQEAKTLNLHNSLTYFLSNPDLLNLPARKHKLFNAYEKLVMVKPLGNGQQVQVLRIWSANSANLTGQNQLWLGAIYKVSIVSPFNLFNFPVHDVNYSDRISEFRKDLSDEKSISLKQKFYEKVLSTDAWRGEVLLVSFNSKFSNDDTDQKTNGLKRRSIGSTGISLLVPEDFSNASDTEFVYEKNGVSVRFQYSTLKSNGSGGIYGARREILDQLENQSVLQLISIEEKPLKDALEKGAEFIVQYDMPPFGNRLVYRVKAMVGKEDVWVVTGIYKHCDTAGKKTVDAMLNSIVSNRNI